MVGIFLLVGESGFEEEEEPEPDEKLLPRRKMPRVQRGREGI